MKKKIIALTISILCMCLLTGCQCEHEWVNADCLNPKTCSKCKETEGEPLGHNWFDADCVNPKTCSNCGETEGEPFEHIWVGASCTSAKHCEVCSIEEGSSLDHILGEWSSKLNIIRCKNELRQHCSMCNHGILYEEEDITSFVVDEMFAFSPAEFMERMESIAKKIYPDFHYNIGYTVSSLEASIYLDSSYTEEATIKFFKDTNVYIPGPDSNADTVGIWCIELSCPEYGTCDELGSLISGDALKLLYLTCDPLLTEDDYQNFAMAKITCAANAITSGYPRGYLEENGLLYEFCHYALAELDISMEAILVYAANWL